MSKELEFLELIEKRYTNMYFKHFNKIDENGQIPVYADPFLGFKQLKQALEELETLRKKETPMKVDIDDSGEFCPICGFDIYGMGAIRFCPDCGQKLDWSEK